MKLIGPLLELCSRRLIRYEALPEDSNVPAILFLNEDFDTMPERHAFLGNYARFCKDIVDSIVQKQPFDALHHILGQADHLLQHLYNGEEPFNGAASPLTLKCTANNSSSCLLQVFYLGS
jgi:exportin-5